LTPRITSRAGRLAYLVATLALSSACGGEIEGTAKYLDCRSNIEVKADDLRMLNKQFVCDTQRTRSGKIMSATCVHVETKDSGSCERAYVYRKRPTQKCPDNAPWLGFDDMCHANSENGHVFAAAPESKGDK
jgi:hypothetical protein